LASSGQDSIHGYFSPVVTTQQTGTITATPALNGCQGNSQTVIITVNPRPVINNMPPQIDSSKCGAPGDILGLVASGGTGTWTYQWSTGGVPIGGNSGNLTNVPGGSYLLTVTDANGCQAWAGPYTIGASTPVIVSASGTPVSGSATLSVSFTGNTTGATSWSWDFGNGTSSGTQNPVGVYTTGGDYVATLVATNAEGCSGMDTVHIHVDQAISLIVPNIFSPNGDNINDEFGFISMGITDLTCEIFNRWGQKVKTLSGATAKWDGKLDNGNAATEGTYFYTVVASSYDGKPHNKQGTITLVK
jgi:gliding motility-associated-like protein